MDVRREQSLRRNRQVALTPSIRRRFAVAELRRDRAENGAFWSHFPWRTPSPPNRHRIGSERSARRHRSRSRPRQDGVVHPISRRSFLASGGALLAGGVLAACRDGGGSAQPTGPTAQPSDPTTSTATTTRRRRRPAPHRSLSSPATRSRSGWRRATRSTTPSSSGPASLRSRWPPAGPEACPPRTCPSRGRWPSDEAFTAVVASGVGHGRPGPRPQRPRRRRPDSSRRRPTGTASVVGAYTSPIGRTRTMPAPEATPTPR